MFSPQPQRIIAASLAVVGLVAGLLIATHFELPPVSPASSFLQQGKSRAAAPKLTFALPEPTAPKSSFILSQQKEKGASPPDLGQISAAFTQIAEKVVPVVVSIACTKIIPAAGFDPAQDRIDGGNFLNERGFRFSPPRAFRQHGSGSGILLTDDGYILTNVHVIERAAKIVVTLHDNRSLPGKIVGVDPLTEVAVIKVDARGLPSAMLGDSDKIVVGEWVLAVGNPLNLSSTVTAGIISAKGRDINIIENGFGVENFFQTDAAINPGNSGGALVNLAGQVIGINTAIATETGFAMGLGFAIPIKLANKIARDLIRYGKVARGYLGLALQEISEVHARALKLDSATGVLVDDVYAGSPAQAGDLQPLDVILAIDGIVVRRVNQVQSLIAGKSPGTIAHLRLLRNGREMEKRILLGNLQVDQPISLKDSPAHAPRGPGFKNLGVEVEPITEAEAAVLGGVSGLLVRRIEPYSPAEESGLRLDDIIIALDRKAINNKADFLSRLQQLKTGDVIIFTVLRPSGKHHLFIEVP